MIDFGYGIALGSIKAENLDVYMRNRNDWKIRRWCRQRHLIDEIGQAEWFEHVSADPTIFMFEMWDLTKKKFAGVCGLTDIDPFNRRAEFSLYVNLNTRGQDYGYKGLKTLVEYGFKDLNLGMIWGETVGTNPAEKTFRRVGFVNTGYKPRYYFKDGQYHDSHLYFLDSDSFFANLSTPEGAKVTHLSGTTT